jgi:type II secretory pathway predicted ATPase ExeA
MRRQSILMPETPAPATQPAKPAPATYLDLYGLSKPPFGSQSEGNFMLFGSHRRTFEQLVDHMINGSGLMVLCAEAGAGKTATMHAAGTVARGSGVRIVRVDRPADAKVDLTQLVAILLSHDDPDLPAADTIQTVRRPPHKAVLVDDLDLLPPDCLQLLARLLRPSAEPLNVAFVATTKAEVAAETADPELVELARMTRNVVRLPRISPAEATQYIERSLWVAGGTTRRLMTPDAVKLVVAQAAGLPGAIDQQMEAVFSAGFARGDTRINSKTVASTGGPAAPRRPARLAPPQPLGAPSRMLPKVASALLAVGAVAFFYRALLPPEKPPPAAPLATPPSPAPVTARPRASPNAPENLSAELLAAVMRRGDQSMALGDIAAARLFYAHAAEAGNARAATALGKTYDPDYLATIPTQHEKPDPARAAAWYRKAAELGDPQAAELLKHFETPAKAP